MCLVNVFRDKNITQSSKRRRVYKVVAKNNDGQLYSPFNEFYWKAGENQSSRTKTTFTQDEVEYGVNDGFHVFYTREDAESSINEFSNMIPIQYLTILALNASPQDYVVSGEWEGDIDDPVIYNAVYTKLYVEQREIERALRKDYSK